MSGESATVEVLTAEVRVLMVGKRQVTLSVFRQLDEVEPNKIEPFGRVRDDRNGKGVQVVGRCEDDGSLVRSRVWVPRHVPSPEDGGWLMHVGRVPKCGEQFCNCAPVLTRDGIVVRWKLPFHSRYAPGVEGVVFSPGREASCTGLAEQQWRALKARTDVHEAWTALPLIVLAGLK